MLEDLNRKREFYLSIACCLSLPRTLKIMAWNRYKEVKKECEALANEMV